MSSFLRMELKMPETVPQYFWTDSKVVLGYINNEAKRFRVYVANRIQQIREHTKPDQWFFVNSESNPADVASRGAKAEDLKDCTLLWNGPKFLKHPGPLPKEDVDTSLQQEDPEVKATSAFATTVTQKTQYASLLERLEYFSSWHRAKKAVALCLRYRDLLLGRSKSKCDRPVTVDELTRAEVVIVASVQTEAFPEELQVLAAGAADDEAPAEDDNRGIKTVRTSSSLYRLDPELNKAGIMCVGGRIRRADLPAELVHPAILPQSHHVTKLVIRECHERTHHAGRGMTLNEIRTSGYWVVKGRSATGKYIMSCIRCKKLRGHTCDQKMADLPTDRVEQSAPFTYSCVDYFGPFLVTERRSKVKRWGVLFTCMASRAVHLETANSLTADAFLNAYRRFASRRGPIRQIRCDQGTNFIGGRRLLEEALTEMSEDKIQRELLKENCDWVHFRMNPPKASHMGGVWERMIRSARVVLEALMTKHGHQLDDELLRTLLTEVELVINSRPLTYPSMSPVDVVEPLTPNQLLTLKSRVVLPPPGRFQNPDLYARQRWRRIQHLANLFWTRWRQEFIPSLQERRKWQQPEPNLEVGDVVSVVADDSPRCSWPLGLVTATYPGADGLVRKVRIRIGIKEYDRPVHRLIVLMRRRDSQSGSLGAGV